jgi:LuxR family maltose regulon positive regulatory protein
MTKRFFFSNMPALPGGRVYLERPHIDGLLEDAVRNPLVMVVAGAGYGKTEAVYSFLKKYNAVTTWIQLSRRDNLASRFWENYTYTLSLSNGPLAARLREAGFPETESQFDRYLSLIENDAPPHARHIFVFDDFHLTENSSVLRFVERSVNVPLPGVTTMILSRKDPPIDMIGLFSKGLVAGVSEEDLRFTEDEMLRFFTMQGIQLSPQALSTIYANTEGWAFAINLAGLALKKKPMHEDYAISLMRLNVFRLIRSEVFSGLSKELQKLLVSLSLIDHLSLEFVRELAPDKKLLTELAGLGTFIRYDAWLDVYRIHHLFLEYLSRKQDMLTEDEKRDIYLKAADWCVKNNYKLDAISYCEKAGAYDRIVDIVYMFQLMLPNRTALFLLELFKKIPQEAYDKNDLLYLLYARFLTSLGMFDRAIPELKAIIARFETRPVTPASSRVLSGLYNNLGFMYYLNCTNTCDYDFLHYFEKGAHYFFMNKYTVEGPVRNLSVGAYACKVSSPEKGHIERFIETIAASEPLVCSTMNGCTAGLTDLVRAEAAYFRSDVKNCEQFAWRSLYRARENRQHEIENRALFLLLRVALAAGNYAGIQTLCKQLELQLDRADYIDRYTLRDTVMGWYYIAIRQIGRVPRWLKNGFDKSDINSLMQGLENIVKARHYLAEKRYHALLPFLEGEENKYGLKAFLYGKIEMKVLEAVCRYHLRERKEALEAFAAAYDVAQPNGLDMFFIEQGNDMRTLAGAALKDKNCAIPRSWLENIRSRSATYAKKLAWVIAACREENHAENDVQLTSREMEMLTDLFQGLSRTEIALSHGLSINTVKATLGTLYAKLGAEDAEDAVRIATSLKLRPAKPAL